MILHSLTVSDFRAFRGTHQISFTPRMKSGVQKPIVLIGGLNGSGKTTLFVAIKLALYGRQAIGLGTSQANYEKFILECLHSSFANLAQPNDAYVELDFSYGKLGRQSRFVVRRSWRKKGRSVDESIRLVEDGQLRDELTHEACQGFLNQLVPLGVSELFFFDGEKIAMLAEDESGTVLGDAIHRLLGLDVVERLRSDLRVYIQRRSKEFAAAETRSEITDLQREYSGIKTGIEASLKEQQCSRNELDELMKERDKLQIQLSERGGDWAVSREVRKERAQSLLEELALCERQLREEMAGCFPLSLAPELLEDVLSSATSGLMTFGQMEANELLTNFAEKLKSSLDDGAMAVVERTLLESQITVDESVPQLDISHRGLARLEHTVHRLIPDAQTRVLSLVERITRLRENLDVTNSEIDRAPDQAVLTDTLGNLNVLDQDAQDLGGAIAVRQRELRRSYVKSIALARALRDKYKRISEFEKSEQPLKYAKAITALLQEFYRIKSKQKIEQLELEFSASFRRLSRKEDIVDRVRIDPVKFTVTLVDRDGHEVNKSQLSAGEKQIYAIAILEALARTSGQRLPVVIDTPLGRLDSHHRNSLICQYFPFASHQVILLSTDTEVDEPFFRELSPNVSHAFEIQFDEEDRSATLNEGYFWRARRRKLS